MNTFQPKIGVVLEVRCRFEGLLVMAFSAVAGQFAAFMNIVVAADAILI